MSLPIGIFDSGVGGLTVAREILRRLPNESLLYFADTAHLPYGSRSPKEIESFALGIISFLVREGVKIVVIACNFSSALIYHKAKELYPGVPIVGVLQAGARMAANSPYEGIGVFATPGTVRTKIYTKEIRRLAPQKRTWQASCPPLVSLIEGFAPEEEIRKALKRCLYPLKRKGIEALLLGCTHYPLVRHLIEEEMMGVEILDPAVETAREVKAILEEHALIANSPPRHRFLASGGSASLLKFVPSILGVDIMEIERIESIGGVDASR